MDCYWVGAVPKGYLKIVGFGALVVRLDFLQGTVKARKLEISLPHTRRPTKMKHAV